MVQSSEEVGSELFNFILTDEDGNQVYCAAMIIYEYPGSEKEQSKMFRTQTRDLEDLYSSKVCSEDSSLLSPPETQHVRRSRSMAKSRGSKDMDQASHRQTFRFISSEGWLVPKCLLLMSKYPFLETLKKLLVGIYKLTRTSINIPMECYILHLFLLLPLPPKGCVEVVYQILNTVVLFKVPPVNQLPLYDSNMSTLFQALPLPTLLAVFTHLLLEDNVVFLSTSTDKLFCCSYTLLSLLYPFKWCLVYVPVLPCQLVDYLYSPVKYVYGLNSEFKDDVLIRCTSEVCIVDLDQGKIEANDEMFNIHSKKRNKNGSATLPEHYAKKVAKKITEVLGAGGSKRIDAVKAAQIRELFFQFFVSILQNYKQYLNYEKCELTNISTYFDEEGFLAKNNKNDREFFKAFFQTQMFANFCDRNIRTTDMDQHFENLLFNEHIISKKNRQGIVIHKKPTLFISDTSQNIKSKYVVPPPETCFSKQGSYFYYTFPCLDYEVLQEYGLPIKSHPKFTESTINIPDTRSLYRQHSFKQKHSDSLYVIWLELWASCLWAQDDVEQTERVTEVIAVLDNMNKTADKPSISIYTFLIEACFHVNPSVALSIFSYMNTMNVLVDATTVLILQKVISKLFSSSKAVNLKSTRHSIEISGDMLSPSSRDSHRKRVFNRKNKRFFASHAINMILVYKCFVCGKESIENKLQCCKQAVTTLIKVKIGLDIGRENFNVEEVRLLTFSELEHCFQKVLEAGNNKSSLNLEELRENNILFWNLIWHFNKGELPYKFFVPYEEAAGGNAFKITLHDDENHLIDLTPQDDNNDKGIQTEIDTNYLISLLN